MKEIAKALRTELKKKLPEHKFSVTSEYNKINVVLLAGPTALPERVNINHYYLEKESKEVQEVFKVVESSLEALAPQKESSYDSDYGSIPNYYKHYEVGQFGKPYKQNEMSAATAEEMLNDFNWVGSRHHY